MKKIFVLLFMVLAISQSLLAQEGIIKGTVTDNSTGETLIGVNILYAKGKGTVTNMDGTYSLELKPGEYNIKASYVGYESKEKTVTVKDGKVTTLDFELNNKTLDAVEVVADMAQTRETPVAFTNVLPAEIEQELAGQDIPMILNKTPGVYATRQGGGDGDSRINIRGFSQRNVAVMIDGIPVNDMENGWVYWSNWFGLDAVTRKIQVQRGLGKSKLAIPSVGGTMNIITKGIDSDPGFQIKQSVGNDYYFRTSISGSTGPLDNGWGATFAYSHKRGNGFADQTWTEGYFYFLRLDKDIGKHRLSFTAMGAPQQHGQRSYSQSIATWDAEYAAELGVDTASIPDGVPTNMGLRYNSHWGYLNRYEIVGGDTIHGYEEKLNTKINYYHKPQFSLRDYWQVNDDLYIYNIAYMSIGQGGGTGLTSTPNLTEEGQVDLQKIYNSNYNNKFNPGRAGDVMYSGRNNHAWYGLLSQVNYRINALLNVSGGVDLRYYRGEHYRQIYDFLGGQYYMDGSVAEVVDHSRPTLRRDEIGDIIEYHNDGLVKWAGGFGQLEYEVEKFQAFLNLSFANKSYKRVDFFKREDIVIDGKRYNQQVGYQYDFVDQEFIPDTVVIDGEKYTINSPEAEPASTGWEDFWGYTAKIGANYNFSDKFNMYGNLGYINKAPRFNNVFDYDNNMYRNIQNESIRAAELGFSFNTNNVSLNVNGYYTKWLNKPADRTPRINIDDESYNVNINGVDALHKGIEVEFGHKVLHNLQYDIVISIGDWQWASKDTARIYDEQQQFVGNVAFNAKGVHVGDAAQHQARFSLNYKPLKHMYLRPAITYFGKHYAAFDPLSLSSSTIQGYSFGSGDYLDDEGNPKDSWQVPDYYLVDVHAGYSWYFDELKLSLQLSVLNVLDKTYISDADNNSQYIANPKYNFDAGSAAVFFGLGRQWNTSLILSF